jgi:hypothetical protein
MYKSTSIEDIPNETILFKKDFSSKFSKGLFFSGGVLVTLFLVKIYSLIKNNQEEKEERNRSRMMMDLQALNQTGVENQKINLLTKFEVEENIEVIDIKIYDYKRDTKRPKIEETNINFKALRPLFMAVFDNSLMVDKILNKIIEKDETSILGKSINIFNAKTFEKLFSNMEQDQKQSLALFDFLKSIFNIEFVIEFVSYIFNVDKKMWLSIIGSLEIVKIFNEINCDTIEELLDKNIKMSLSLFESKSTIEKEIKSFVENQMLHKMFMKHTVYKIKEDKEVINFKSKFLKVFNLSIELLNRIIAIQKENYKKIASNEEFNFSCYIKKYIIPNFLKKIQSPIAYDSNEYNEFLKINLKQFYNIKKYNLSWCQIEIQGIGFTRYLEENILQKIIGKGARFDNLEDSSQVMNIMKLIDLKLLSRLSIIAAQLIQAKSSLYDFNYIKMYNFLLHKVLNDFYLRFSKYATDTKKEIIHILDANFFIRYSICDVFEYTPFKLDTKNEKDKNKNQESKEPSYIFLNSGYRYKIVTNLKDLKNLDLKKLNKESEKKSEKDLPIISQACLLHFYKKNLNIFLIGLSSFDSSASPKMNQFYFKKASISASGVFGAPDKNNYDVLPIQTHLLDDALVEIHNNS